MEIHAILQWMVEQKASDLHLKEGLPPVVRLDGSLVRVDVPPVDSGTMRRWLESVAPPGLRDRLELDREADFAFDVPGVCRFRTSVFHQMGRLGAVIRTIPATSLSLDDLGMPEGLKLLAEKEYGLVLVTGPTGSGKSTTLAAMVDHINSRTPCHILTIEDPVEFVHVDKMAVVNQREVGSDTPSFAEALRRALRQDPDVIVVGEMRDPETMTIAMMAAETGHLVLSTAHTSDARQTIDRIINSFAPEEHHAIRMKLSVTLAGVVSQHLVPRADGKGRVAVQEIMINSPTVRKLIEDNRVGGIDKALEESADYYGMQSMNAHLLALWRGGIVKEEDAIAISNNPSDLRLKMQTERFGAQAATPAVPSAASGQARAGGLEGRYGG